MSYYVSAAALDSVVTRFLAIVLDVEAGIEKTEAAIEPWRHAGIGIENQRADECRGVIAALLQDFGEVRQ